MKFSSIYSTLIVTILCFGSCKKEAARCVDYVDPFIGTAYTGHTFPGATYPFGFMQPGPQTGNFGWEYCSGYNYEDSLIWGFTQNRLNGTGIPDLGDILIMPYSGVSRDDFKSFFRKETEKASPGYYRVSLDDSAVDVELTCTPRVAMHRYRFKGGQPMVYINFQSGNVSMEPQYDARVLEAEIKTEDNRTITGYIKATHWVERQLFFVIQFDTTFLTETRIGDNLGHKAPTNLYRFDPKASNELNLKIAFSTVSVEGARKNMESELNHWNFDKVRKDVEDCWERYLARVQVEGTTDQKKNFYTSMYHLMIQPNIISDVDGRYRGANDSVAVSPTGKYHSTFSLWDTYRAAHPLYTILASDQVSDMVNSMLLHAETAGCLPIWALWGKENYCMIGNHAVPVVVEACLKNFPGIDQEKAYRLVRKSLTENHYKSDWAVYDRYGYYPFDLAKEESVSRTLECGYDDYCAAQLAAKLGLQDDYDFFMKRAAYYKNLFDPEAKLMRGKDSQGNWRTPFNAFALSHAGTAGGDYTEGNAWQYSWHVPHDPEGLIELMGGNDAFISKLDSLFRINVQADVSGFVGDVTGLIGQYAHGNEPSHHVIYLYNLAGAKWRTEELVRNVFDEFYQPRPDGLCGNDDCGQMSAWYIFSAMGFYPVNTVNGEYVLGAPQVPGVTISLPGDKTFAIRSNNLSDKNKYVKSVKLNGVEINNSKITYDQIMQGGMLVFEMCDLPDK